MKLTPELKAYLVKHCGVAEDASDDDFRKAAGEAFATGKLTAEKYTELTTTKEESAVDALVKGQQKTTELLGELVQSLKGGDGAAAPTKPIDDETDKSKAKADDNKDTEPETKPATKSQSSRLSKAIAEMGGTPDNGGKDWDVRVKEAADQYSTTKSASLYPESTKNGRPHPLAGQRVTDFGRGLDDPSNLDKALAGVWAKFQLAAVTPRIAGSSQRAFEMLNEHEKELLCFLTEKSDWDDSTDGKLRTVKGYQGVSGRGRGIKALIDDSTSGGLEAAPIVFDDQVIQAPLLNGELFPLVNTVPLDRGRRIEGVSIGTVTGSWGGVDDTAITLFTTTSYVSAFDTTVFRWEGSIRIGLDFMSDTPLEFGSLITAQYGERLLEDLDDVIAAGNGTTQPEGLLNKTGATSVSFSGTTSIGNYESLRFGVAKNEHGASVKNSAVFVGTETSYQRARAIPVGASDARRLGGMNYDSYSWMERPYKINESLTNAQIIYAILARYRMYRRRGLTVRTSTEGDTLIRRNEMLVVVMARYGGQAERGAVVAVTTTGEA